MLFKYYISSIGLINAVGTKKLSLARYTIHIDSANIGFPKSLFGTVGLLIILIMLEIHQIIVSSGFEVKVAHFKNTLFFTILDQFTAIS